MGVDSAVALWASFCFRFIVVIVKMPEDKSISLVLSRDRQTDRDRQSDRNINKIKYLTFSE